MSVIDRQRISAVRTMEVLGYSFDGIEWRAPLSTEIAPISMQAEADAMHALLVLRADKLEGCTEGSEEEAELKNIVGAVTAYEAKRWPNGVVPRAKE